MSNPNIGKTLARLQKAGFLSQEQVDAVVKADDAARDAAYVKAVDSIKTPDQPDATDTAAVDRVNVYNDAVDLADTIEKELKKAAKKPAAGTAPAAAKPAESKPEPKKEEPPVAKKNPAAAKPAAKKPAKKKPVAKPAPKKAAKAPAKKAVNKEDGRRGSDKQPGVVRTIAEIVVKKGPITREGVVKELKRVFPDRKLDALAKTVKSHLPYQLVARHKFAVTEKDGKFSAKKVPDSFKTSGAEPKKKKAA